MLFGQKWGKILIVPSFQLKFDDVTVTLSLNVLSRYFYKLTLILFTSYQNLLRLNVIFMVRKIGQLLLNGGGGGGGVVATPQHSPFV